MRQLVIQPSFDRDWKKLTSEVQDKVRPHLFALCDMHLLTRKQDIHKLVGVAPPLFRLRVGDYRVIFAFDTATVSLLNIGHRKDIYRG